MTSLNVDDLIQKELVQKKTYTDGDLKNLSVVKYTRKVFFNQLWNEDKRLLDCRGTVIDNNNNIIMLPFTKVFNYKENNTYINHDRLVTCPRKINGFLGIAKIHNNKKIIGTTGSLDSDFTKLAAKHIHNIIPNLTMMFEICDPSDPHIVPEKAGAYLIGARKSELNSPLLRESELDLIAIKLGYLRPEVVTKTFGEILEDVKYSKNEGFMVRDAITEEVLCKIKSPYYLTTKSLARIGSKVTEVLFNNTKAFKQRIDEEFYELVDFIVANYTKEEWHGFSEYFRRTIIENFFANN